MIVNDCFRNLPVVVVENSCSSDCFEFRQAKKASRYLSIPKKRKERIYKMVSMQKADDNPLIEKRIIFTGQKYIPLTTGTKVYI